MLLEIPIFLLKLAWYTYVWGNFISNLDYLKKDFLTTEISFNIKLGVSNLMCKIFQAKYDSKYNAK